MISCTIGLAEADEVQLLPEIERRAGTLFSPDDLAPELARETPPLALYAEAQREGRLLVARNEDGRVVGFSFLLWIDGHAHLEEVDVEPNSGRRGMGRALVEASCDWATERGSDRITLSTFRDVAWNAPFYARLGFVAIPRASLSPALLRVREHEASDGLDPEKRIMMSRML